MALFLWPQGRFSPFFLKGGGIDKAGRICYRRPPAGRPQGAYTRGQTWHGRRTYAIATAQCVESIEQGLKLCKHRAAFAAGRYITTNLATRNTRYRLLSTRLSRYRGGKNLDMTVQKRSSGTGATYKLRIMRATLQKATSWHISGRQRSWTATGRPVAGEPYNP